PAIPRGPRRRPGAADQAPVIALPRLELGEGGAYAQPVDVAREESPQKGRDQSVGRLVSQTTPQQRPERTVGRRGRRAPNQDGGRAQRPPPRHSRPPPELAQVGRYAERPARKRQQPPLGPDHRGTRRRRLELRAEPELPAELHPRRLAREQRVRPGLDPGPGELDRAHLATRRRLGLEDDQVDVARAGSIASGAQEPVGGGQTRDAPTDD